MSFRFYVKPEIVKLLENVDSIPKVEINKSRWYNISQSDYEYLVKLVARLDAIPIERLTEKEKWKYSTMLHRAERIARCSVPYLREHMK